MYSSTDRLHRIWIYASESDIAYVGKPTLVIISVRMLHFTKQYKDTLQMRLMILMSVCSRFITVYVYQ